MTPYSPAEQTILDDPLATAWLKKQILDLHRVDPKASVADCETLAAIQAQRCLERGIPRRGQ